MLTSKYDRRQGDNTAHGPGKAHIKGVTLAQLLRMFPKDEVATEWFEGIFWGREHCCPKCGNMETKRTKNAKPMSYWCADCRKYPNVGTGTVMARSHISLQNWAFVVYLAVTNLEGVSCMNLQRDLGINQMAAWFMLRRIREVSAGDAETFSGPFEVDETCVDGLKRDEHGSEELRAGRGSVGMKDRDTNRVAARVVDGANKGTLLGLVHEHAQSGAKVCAADTSANRSRDNHETLKHSAGESVNGMAHTSGVVSFWSMLQRAREGGSP